MAKSGASDQTPQEMPWPSASLRLNLVQRTRLGMSALTVVPNSPRNSGRPVICAPAGDLSESGAQLGFLGRCLLPGGPEPVPRVAEYVIFPEEQLSLHGEPDRPVVMDADDQVTFRLGQASSPRNRALFIVLGDRSGSCSADPDRALPRSARQRPVFQIGSSACSWLGQWLQRSHRWHASCEGARELPGDHRQRWPPGEAPGPPSVRGSRVVGDGHSKSQDPSR